MIEVRIIRPDQLSAPWAAATSDELAVLFVRDDADMPEVLAGYKTVHRRFHAA